MSDDSVSVEVVLEELKEKHAYVRCNVCNMDGQKVDIVASVRKHSQYSDKSGHHVFDAWDHYQTLKCGGCETVFFRTTSANSEDVDFEYDHDGQAIGRYNVSERLYPETTAERNTIKEFHLLPPQLAAIYTEAAKALYSNQPVLAGIGIRAILETICKDKAAPGKNLYEQIDGLKNQGALSVNGALVLHKLRVLGNTSAHEVKPQSDDQLSLAFDVLDNLLMNVYVLEPQVAKIFP
jgi:hypothetical protein